MDWRKVLLDGFFIFIGVVAGTFVNIMTTQFEKWRNEKKDIKNVKFEIEMNLKKINTWCEYLNELRNNIAFATVNKFNCWFDFSKIITITSAKMFQNGSLYRYLDHVHIALLQSLLSELGPNTERYFSDKIELEKNSFDKDRAIQTAQFLETKIKNWKKGFEDIFKALK